MIATDLTRKKCQACEGGIPPMSRQQIDAYLPTLPGWELKGGHIEKTYRFDNFHETMAFVNVVAWVAHREGHHPDLQVSYGQCTVQYHTHAIGGLSENDFICAAKVEQLLS